jgi:tetratricopeptide (TPR) repeat protein
MSSSEALEALERREYARALALLERDLAARPDGELHALAGLANFQLERYDAAAQHYTAALQADGLRSDWREMLALAQANDTDGVNVYVPALHYYDRNALLAPASLRDGALPPLLPPGPGQGHFKRLRLFLGESLGVVATVLMDSITRLLGWIAGYRDNLSRGGGSVEPIARAIHERWRAAIGPAGRSWRDPERPLAALLSANTPPR